MTFAVAANEKGKKVLTMAEYIERGTAIAWFMPYAHAGESIDADVVISDIKGMKAADVAPVRHGQWISLTDCANAGVYCSECKKKVWKEDYAPCNRKNKLRSRFCPNCGAKMGKEEE